MDEQAQVVEVRRRRSRAEAEQVAGEYEASGLSRVEFCRQHGMSLATLARYRKWRAQGEVAAGNRWGAVEVSGTDPALEGELSSRGLDAYQSAYTRYTFCAVCEPEDGWVTLLSEKLWPSEVIRRVRPALQPFNVHIARPN